MHLPKAKTNITICIGLLLFVLFCIRFWLASVHKVLNDDETTAFLEAYRLSYGTLLKNGIGGASTSPLFYFADKLIYQILGSDMHHYWNLRFITRVPYACYWALACSFLFIWSTKRLHRLAEFSFPFALITSLAFSFFLHSNAFMDTYAIEARGYSLWVTLTLIQTLLWLDLIRDPLNRKYWTFFAIINFLNCFNSYTALTQLFLNLFFLAINFKIFHIGLSRFLFFKYATTTAIPSIFISFYYYAQSARMHYPPGYFTLKNYTSSIFEIISKTFHHHNASALLFSIPILAIIHFFLFKKIRKSIWIPIHCIGGLLLTVFFFKISELKGGIWAPRYVIFLIPSFAIFYFSALIALSKYIAKGISKITHRHTYPFLVLIIWSLIEILSRSNSYVKTAYSDWHRSIDHKIYKKTENPDCPDTIFEFGHLGNELEKLNDICRN